MLILLGYLVVLGTVFGGYLMTGGSLGALYQPAELVIIAGAGIGSFIVGNNGKAIKGTLKRCRCSFVAQNTPKQCIWICWLCFIG
ncbi:hypothetical protein DJICPGNB_07765 [Escherichia coli]|nr:hypothetical protein DJICPGNB_07765 [Escherichia coli]